MAHEDAGHYAAKHPAGTQLNPVIAEQVKAKIVDDRISCAAAHEIARALGVSPADVGIVIDLLEVRINRCQLGLFGHRPQKRIVTPAEHVSPELRHAIEAACDERGLSCFNAWQIADQRQISRLEVACACETLNIKISSCQLGSFG
ncbi:hypothetical protein GF339_22070 [candidate division KSB3 bacterium]|uniref:Uncharacterized protein n=1 Tax=candidate division KSB3 bacterium TaxID=2044937 RepID=A0A9D5JZV0_9BACT|nr:hypothetical protein [candidate division KSB3 bacterium]MBD3327289.1 hypothetical protein [candidate division KSB3 bacterium]